MHPVILSGTVTIMNWDEESLAEALHQTIQIVAAQRGENLARNITPIILANLDRGRVQNFLDNGENCQPDEYVWRVVTFYEKWQPYLHQIQEERQPDLWLSLYDRLKRWAYKHLSNKNFPPLSSERWQLAEDCATTAAVRLLNARFPYDVDFDPWAYILLQNVTLKHLHQQYEETADNLHQVDDWEEWEGVMPQLSLPDPGADFEMRHTLLTAIDLLASDARKQIIIWRYFEGMSFQEIATALNRSYTAVHKLHFDALNNLRKIWQSLQDKYE